MIWGLLIYVFNFWKFRGSFLSLIFGFWKFLKCILNQNSYFWGGVCFMNFLIWGFLNDFINSSGIIFEFHYNFIIFFCVWVPRFYTKNFNFFLPPIPLKKWLFLQNFIWPNNPREGWNERKSEMHLWTYFHYHTRMSDQETHCSLLATITHIVIIWGH